MLARPLGVCLLWLGLGGAVGAEAAPFELRPSIAVGYSKVVEAHGSLSVGLRVQVIEHLFVQAEYLALVAEGHTDQGPVVAVGLSGGRQSSFRLSAGVGGGPVRGFQGDDDIFFVFGGLSRAVGRSGLFAQGEVRYGLLGESVYSQASVSFGWSR